MKHFPSCLLPLLFVLLLTAVPALAGTKVAIETSQGTINVELEDGKAPLSVKNFLAYADQGFYDGTIFHRVIRNFMIQGGGFSSDLAQKATLAPIRNEAANGLKNQRGTLAMARTPAVDSATSQFFINLVDNAFLDYRDSSSQGFGYAVFGRVVAGMEVVDRIGSSPTGTRGRFSDVPLETVTIKSVRRIN